MQKWIGIEWVTNKFNGNRKTILDLCFKNNFTLFNHQVIRLNNLLVDETHLTNLCKSMSAKVFNSK